MRKTVVLVLLFLLFSVIFLHGERVDDPSLIQVSKNWMSQFENVDLGSAELQSTEQFGSLSIRVITFDQGFVIVSDDTRIKPILGYSPDNTISDLSEGSNVMSWLTSYSEQINYIKANNLRNASFESEWQQLLSSEYTPDRTEEVTPLLSTEWGQGQFYNDFCPYDTYSIAGNDHALVGCVATAMAQCMKYWGYPETGTGSYSYTHSNYGVLSADFSNTTYNWSDMPDKAIEENLDLATIMYHAGVSVNMGYGPTESAASVLSAYNAFKDNFNYDSDLSYENRNNYSDSEWENLIKSELESGHPVYYRGEDTTIGHAFICDGYENSNYFHMNWGWDGDYNGYFQLSNLTPLPGYSYTNNQSAMIGLVPGIFQETLEIRVDNDSGETGTMIEVSIETNSLSSTWNFTDFDLELTYDTSILNYDSYLIENTISEECSISIVENQPGVLTVSANSLEALSGSGSLFNLVFLAENPGTASIGVNSFQYNTYEVNDLLDGEVVVSNYTEPAGNGSEDDPYQIETIENLLWLSKNNEYWDKHYIQTADINAAVTTHINDGAGFTPIGNDSIKFSGSYDGQFHIIENLFISLPEADYVGLFGYIQYGEISNIGLENVDIQGYRLTAALVGVMYSNTATVSNCYSTGNVVGYQSTAGLIAQCSTNMSNCYSCCEVTSYYIYPHLISGLVSSIVNSDMENCYFGGAIDARNANGLISHALQSNIGNSFWDVEVSGVEASAGGLGVTTAQMQNINTYINAGWDFMNETENGNEGIWGINQDVNNGYPFLSWQGYDQSNQPPSLLTPINDVYTSRDFEDITIDLNEHFSDFENDEMTFSFETSNPGVQVSLDESILQISSVADYSGEVEVTVSVQATASGDERVIQSDTFTMFIFSEPMPGEGTEINPYQINCFEHLCWISKDKSLWDKHFIQISDIDASDSEFLNDSLGAVSIGNDLQKFTGSYNGQDYTISDFYINRPNTDYLGLFGVIDSASLTNVRMENSTIICYDYSGSLVGQCFDSTISNCSSSTTINCHDMTGGLIGSSSSSTIEFCSSSGTLNGSKHLGGLVSRNNGIVTDCFSSVDVSSTSCHSGGLVEGNYYGASIINSYSTGNVEAFYAAGGLLSSNWGEIINSYYNYETVLINGEYRISDGALSEEMFTQWLGNNRTLDINDYLVSNGSEYIISNNADFKKLLAFCQGKNSFILESDIDMAEDINFFIPYFDGIFNGNAHKIENLEISLDDYFCVALFGCLYEAEIKNLEVKNVNLFGKGDVAALAGKCTSSLIEKCSSSGIIEGTYRNGGLVGYSCHNSEISNCFSSCSVSGQENIGGLLGKHGSSSSDDFSEVKHCYSLGDITEEAQNSGGLVGHKENNNNCFVTDSFWNMETSGATVSTGGTGLTTAEMQNIQTYLNAGWDFYTEFENGFEEVWNIDQGTNNGYPYFNWLPVPLMADFSASETIINIGDEIQFNDASYGNPTTWAWDFDNDGIIDSAEQNPVWSYDTDGTYTVSLTVSDGSRSVTSSLKTKSLSREVDRNRTSDVMIKDDFITVNLALPQISLTQNSIHFDIDKDVSSEQTQLLTISNTGNLPLEIELSSEITVTDFDGNVYQTVKIGNQLWTKENLRTTHYYDGTAIPNITDNSEWASLETGAYCAYNNDESIAQTYGYLYNWFVVEGGNFTSDEWHVPTDGEIMQFEMFLGMSEDDANAMNWRGTNQGSQLAGNEELWNDSELENEQDFGTTHFTFLPGGYRKYDVGISVHLNSTGSFWSSSEHYNIFAWQRSLNYDETGISRSYEPKNLGNSVRLVRDIANLANNDNEEQSSIFNTHNSYNSNSRISNTRDPLNTWLSFTPTTITLSSGASIDIAVTANADTLANGDYSDGLYISSNDNENDLIFLPLTMSVSGNQQPVIDFDGLVIEFDEDNQSEVIDLSPYISDPDNDLNELSLSAVNSEHIIAELDGFNVTFSAAENWSGSEEIAFTLDDNFDSGSRMISESKLPEMRSNREISDQSRAVCENHLTVTVLPVNDDPVLDLADVEISFEEDAVLEDVDFSSYLSDIDNSLDELTLSAANSEHITVTVDGFEVSFSAEENWFGTETIVFTLDDNVSRSNLLSSRSMGSKGNRLRSVIQAELEVTVSPVNDAPIIVFPENFSYLEDESETYNFAEYISDIDNTLEELSLSWSGNDNINVEQSGWEITFSSNTENWCGSELITFTLDDGANVLCRAQQQNRDSVTESITVNCEPVNDNPDINLPDSFSFAEDDSLIVDFSDYISDIDNENLNITVADNSEISVEIASESVILRAAENWYGEETIIFTVDDNQTRATACDTVEIFVNPVNDSPVITSFVPEEGNINLASAETITFTIQTEDVDSDVEYSWLINDTAQDSETNTLEHSFNENGEYEVKCIISDEEFQLEQIWNVVANITGSGQVETAPAITGINNVYPNPFNPTTTVKFSVKKSDIAEISIYNIKGQQVKKLGEFGEGSYTVQWHGQDDSGSNVGSGLYLMKLQSKDKTELQKLILLK